MIAESSRPSPSSPSSSIGEPQPCTSSAPVAPSTSRASSAVKRVTGFASRSLRKNQWRLFKHRTFFGSRGGSTKGASPHHLTLPRLTLRHPSVDGQAMALALDPDSDCGAAAEEHTDLLHIRAAPRRWTETETTSRFTGGGVDSRESSGFHDSRELLDELLPAQPMTAPVSPCVPLSTSSSVSEGWKYSQKLLWKLKPRYINFSHASSTSSSTDSAWKSLVSARNIYEINTPKGFHDSTTWRSTDGTEVVLKGARLEELSDVERHALQSLALARLPKLLPGVTLNKQKDVISSLKQKRQKLLKSGRTLTVNERRVTSSEEKKVFGVSLHTCVQNDRRYDLEMRCRSLDDSAVCLSVPSERRKKFTKTAAKSVRSEPEIVKAIDEKTKWHHGSATQLTVEPANGPPTPSPVEKAAPVWTVGVRERVSASPHYFSQEEPVVHRFTKKLRPTFNSMSSSMELCREESCDVHSPQVPRIVANCTEYLLKYGLHTVGLFRVAGSTKRCRELRSALERGGGHHSSLLDTATPHDIATLLKEYFRDLPQSLLPKEHYQAYIATAKLSEEERLESVRLLVSLLATPNVDTLFVLLSFLHEVAANAADRDEGGSLMVGNKMDARNLATIFAPSILRPDHSKLQDSLAETEQQIQAVETLINHIQEIFRIPRELQCKMYNKLRETDPDGLDRVLNGLSRHEVPEHALTSPFEAMPEEESIDVPREVAENGKVPAESRRSGSWPFSLTRSPRLTRFFHSDSENSCPSQATVHGSPLPIASTQVSVDRAEQSSVCGGVVEAKSSGGLKSAARSHASAARRRLRNVVRAFRFSSVTRSTPNVSSAAL